MKKLLLISYLFLKATSVFAMYFIDQPGQYTLGDSLVVSGTNVVEIASSNVILDLNQFGLIGGVNGIFIHPGLSNILIKNGFITDIDQTGIIIKEDCSAIVLKDIAIILCDGAAVEIAGTGTDHICSNIFLENISSFSNCSSSFCDTVLSVSYSSEVFLGNCYFLANGAETQPALNIAKLFAVLNLTILDSLFMSNLSSSMTVLNVIDSQDVLVQNCELISNRASTQDLVCVALTGSVCDNTFSNCLLLTNSADQGNVTGMWFDQQSQRNICKSCSVVSSNGAKTYGFIFSGSGSPSTNNSNIISTCDAANNQAFSLTATSIGLLINGADRSTVESSNFALNCAPNGFAAGIVIGQGNDWVFRNNQIAQNEGDSDNNSYGVYVQSGSANIFVQNYSLANGNIPSNQFAGVPSNSQTMVDSSNINNATAPFTNLAVTP